MRGLAAAALLTALLILAVGHAPRAHAHGAQFKPPPPGGPGQPQPLKSPKSNTPTAVTPGAGGPIVTPGGSGFMKPGLVGRRKKREITQTYETSWHPWWRMRERTWMPARRTALMAVITPSEGATPKRTPWMKERDDVAREQILAFLRKTLDPAARHKPDVVASALIALGKLAVDDTDVPLLMDWLMNPQAPAIARESAALGLGLLRRTEPARQLAALRLDGIRGTLLQVFDGRAGKERIKVTPRLRQFAILALGLLGDQPFTADPHSKDGRLMSQLLWQRLTVLAFRNHDEPIAILNALSLQPPEGISTAIRDGLRDLVDGKKFKGRSFHPRVRAHALTTLIRLGASSERSSLARILQGRRTPLEVKIAAVVALGWEAERMASVERVVAARVLESTLKATNQKMLIAGLMNLALGEVLGADLREGSERVLKATKNGGLLRQRAGQMPWYLQGFSALALGTALRDVKAASADSATARFQTQAAQTLRQILGDSRKEEDVRAAAAVGLGLIGDVEAVASLRATLRNVKLTGDFRGYAALASAMIGVEKSNILEALHDAATKPGPEVLRARAAMALSVFGGKQTAEPLIRELAAGGNTRRLAGVTMALGRLGELSAVGPLVATASDSEQKELVQAMAIVALGILADPEPRPSVLRYADGAVYPLRTEVLEELFTIL